MVFNSYTFLIFVLVVVAVNYSPTHWTFRKAFLLFASYLFYAAWDAPFVVLIWISTIVDWVLARRLYNAKTTGARRFYLVLSLLTNLGLLGYFKYSGFLLESFVGLLDSANIVYAPRNLDIILPVGISFYTFQTLSYTIDIYRGHLKPWHSFLDYALFVTFFPQLVAGPIVRARDFLPQTEKPKKFNATRFGWGGALTILGLFQKVVIADSLLAPIVEKVYDRGDVISPLASVIGTLAFAGQIFCDFAGYSTIAIGVAMCLGFALPDNFRFPYASIGFSDFWTRWHISLSSWLRDYLYISLGGNRGGVLATYRNLLVTMLLGGLWHGASWTFVVWGALHGSYLVAERLAKQWAGDQPVWRQPWMQACLGLLTFALVCLAWVFFRADSFATAFAIITSWQYLFMALPGNATRVDLADTLVTVVVMATMLALQWRLRDHSLEWAVAKVPNWLKSVILSLMLVAIAMAPGEDRAFIYFQF